MKQKIRMRFIRITFTGWLIAGTAGWILAEWNGAGVSGGTNGENINDPVNWTGGIIDNVYSGITENVDLHLTANHTVTNGLNFGTTEGVRHHLILNGTQTLTLDATDLPNPNYSANVLLPGNALSTVTFGKDLTLDLGPSGNRYLIGAGQMVVDSQVSGAGGLRIVQTANGNFLNLYLRNDANTFRGEPSPLAGGLFFTSIADTGVPSALGEGNSILLQTRNMVYIGTRDGHSDRRIRINAIPTFRNDSASGSLTLTGEVLMGGGKNHHFLSLGGISSGTNLLEGSIANNLIYLDRLTGLVKIDSGTWRLTGTNTFTWVVGKNDITFSGGALIADYVNDSPGAGSNRVFVAGRSVMMEDGHFVFQGKAGTGNTTFQKMGVFTVHDFSANTLTVDSNSGDGTTVEVDSFESVGTSSMLLIDRKGSATLRNASVIPTTGATVQLVNGMLMGNMGTDALFLIRDPDGQIGFPAQADDLSIVRHTNTLALTESNASTYAGDHLSLTSDITRTDDLSFSTLVINASENAVTLDMGGKSIQTDASAAGRGIIAYGSYPVTVTDGNHGAQASSYLFNYGTGKFTWDIGVNKVYTAGGTGLIEFTQPFNTTFSIIGGTVRLSTDMNYTKGSIRVMGDGVIELGADLNGETAGDFTGAIRGSGGIIFYSGGGFSAYGRNRTVNLGGLKEQLNWGETAGFLKTGKPFILSSPYADATVIFENPLELSPKSTGDYLTRESYLENAMREIRVQNGSAAIDARLTGAINSDYVIAGIIKSGEGTLELTGVQDYLGNVSVIGGSLRLGTNNIYHAGNALVLDNATLDAGISHNVFDTLEMLNDSTINVDGSSTSLSFADSSEKLWTGTLIITGNFGSKTLRFGTDKYGLTQAQLEMITYGNDQKSPVLDEHGYLVKSLGTCLIVR